MTIDDKITAEKLRYDINREVPKTSALSSGKIYKYRYLTDEEILHFSQIQNNRISQNYIFSSKESFGKITKEKRNKKRKKVILESR